MFIIQSSLLKRTDVRSKTGRYKTRAGKRRINERAMCDARWEWHERAPFEKLRTKWLLQIATKVFKNFTKQWI